MEPFTFLPQNKAQLTALKAFAKAHKIPVENKKKELTMREKTTEYYGTELVEKIEKVKENISTYDPEFVKKIKDAKKNANFKEIDANDLWGSLGLK